MEGQAFLGMGLRSVKHRQAFGFLLAFGISHTNLKHSSQWGHHSHATSKGPPDIPCVSCALRQDVLIQRNAPKYVIDSPVKMHDLVYLAKTFTV